MLDNFKNYENQFASVIALIAIYSFGVLLLISNRLPLLITAAVGIFLFALLSTRLLSENIPGKTHVTWFGLALFLSAAFVVIYYNAKISFYVVNAIVAVGLVFALYQIKPIHTRYVLYIITGVWIFIVLFKIDLDESFVTIGQNGITLHFLVFYVIYFFRVHYRTQELNIGILRCENYFFASVLLTMAVWSQGRAATATALIVFCVATLLLMHVFTGKKNYWILLLSSAVVLFNYYSPLLMGERPYSAVDRLEISGFSDVRYTLWLDYFKTLTSESFFMGNRDSNCHVILSGYTRESCNIHNSYLRAHQAYGLFGVFLMLGIIFWCVRCMLQLRSWFSISIIMALLLRIMTDEGFFTTPYLLIILFVYTRLMGVRSASDFGGAK